MIGKIKMGYHILKVIRRPESEIKSIIYLSNIIGQWQSSRSSIQRLYDGLEELGVMHNTAYGLKPHKLKDYLQYGSGTLGEAFYKFYAGKGLDVYPGRTTKGNSKEEYVLERLRKSHDFIHLVMGFDTDEEGEAMVNAFVLNQLRLPFSLFIIMGVILRTIAKKPKRFYTLLQKIINAWKLSHKTQSILTFRWEELLDKPFGQVVQSFRREEYLKEKISFNSHRPTKLPIEMCDYGISIFESQVFRPPLLM